MIQLIKTPTATEFFKLLSFSKKEVILCAPFIKETVIKTILSKKNKFAKLTVITSSNIANFLQGSSDLKAVDTLVKNRVTVKNYQNLHAKIYLFDSMKALVTSANLTNGGLNHNYEYGVLIWDDEESINIIESDFKQMMSSELCGEFGKHEIDYLKNTLELLKKGECNVKEKNDENILEINDPSFITNGLSTWQRDIFFVICNLNEVFSINDIYRYKYFFKEKHPSNNNIEAKIRQVLQQLRDRGLLKFIQRGIYRKLFIVKTI